MRRYDVTILGLTIGVELGRDDNARKLEQFKSTNNYYDGDFETWDAAINQAQGYGAASILEKTIDATRRVLAGQAAFERDAVIYPHPEASHPLLAWLLYAAAHLENRLRVLDFGGALGSSYHQHRQWFDGFDEILWAVVEQAGHVDAGRMEFENDVLKFYFSIEEGMTAVSPNFGLMSATLQYLNNPHETLEKLLSIDLPYLFIGKTLAHRDRGDRIVVQHVPEWIYKANYPVWLLNADKIESMFDRHGYQVVDCFDPYPGNLVHIDDLEVPYVSWFIKKKPGTAGVSL